MGRDGRTALSSTVGLLTESDYQGRRPLVTYAPAPLGHGLDSQSRSARSSSASLGVGPGSETGQVLARGTEQKGEVVEPWLWSHLQPPPVPSRRLLPPSATVTREVQAGLTSIEVRPARPGLTSNEVRPVRPPTGESRTGSTSSGVLPVRPPPADWSGPLGATTERSTVEAMDTSVAPHRPTLPTSVTSDEMLGQISALQWLTSLRKGSAVGSTVPSGSSIPSTPCPTVISQLVENPPPTLADVKKEEVEQASFNEVLGWMWEAFPDREPKPESAKKQGLASMAQTLAEASSSDTPTPLPWSDFHKAIDKHLTCQVAGVRDGKRDKPLTKGSLIPMRRISKLYRVEGDALALEPSAAPPEWFRLTAELPSASRSATLTTSDLDSVESSFRRSKSISNFMDWQMGLLSSLLKDDDNMVDLNRVRRVVQSIDRGSTQLAWETSVGLSNIQLKRRDAAISKLSSTVPEEHKQALRASDLCRSDLFERTLVKEADTAFQEATQRKATLTLLGSKVASATKSSTPWKDSGQHKKASSGTNKPSSKRKRSRGSGDRGDKKKEEAQAPHSSAPAKRGGGRGGRSK